MTEKIVRRKHAKLPIIGGRGYTGLKLDGKLCFELWVHRGSARKAALALKNEYKIINEYKNKPYTTESIFRAAKFWILDNPDDARHIWEGKYGEVEDDAWYDYLSRASYMLVRQDGKRYKKWREKNPEVVAYEESKSQQDIKDI